MCPIHGIRQLSVILVAGRLGYQIGSLRPSRQTLALALRCPSGVTGSGRASRAELVGELMGILEKHECVLLAIR